MILVTGAGGFIGGHLVTRLLSRGEKVRAVDIKPVSEWFQHSSGTIGIERHTGDLSLKKKCEEVVKSDTRQIYNLAADMGGMGFIESNKAACMLSVLINTHLLIAASDADVERYFYASSACVYAHGKQTETSVTALKEEDAYPAMPEDGYGWEKLFSERMVRHFSEDFGITSRVARFHNVYGPEGTYEGGREKAPAAICRKVIEAKLTGQHDIEIWGDGEQTRSFMYIDDCIDGILRIMESKVNEPINLGSSELVSINQLVDLVEGFAGIKLNRHYNLSAPQGVRGRNSDNRMILSRLGWQPSTSLAAGMEKTYAWIYDQMVT